VRILSQQKQLFFKGEKSEGGKVKKSLKIRVLAWIATENSPLLN